MLRQQEDIWDSDLRWRVRMWKGHKDDEEGMKTIFGESGFKRLLKAGVIVRLKALDGKDVYQVVGWRRRRRRRRK